MSVFFSGRWIYKYKSGLNLHPNLEIDGMVNLFICQVADNELCQESQHASLDSGLS